MKGKIFRPWPFPKVVLEEAPQEEEETEDKASGFLTPKNLLFWSELLLLEWVCILITNQRKREKALAEQQKIKEQQDKLEVFIEVL